MGVVVEILITQSQPEKALPHEFFHAVFDLFLLAGVGEAPCQHPADPKPRIKLAQKQRAPVRTQITTAEISHDFFTPQVVKEHWVCETDCLEGLRARVLHNLLHGNMLWFCSATSSPLW